MIFALLNTQTFAKLFRAARIFRVSLMKKKPVHKRAVRVKRRPSKERVPAESMLNGAHWEKLIGRIAERTLQEWRVLRLDRKIVAFNTSHPSYDLPEPSKYALLQQRLPDLARANPRRVAKDGQPGVRLLDGNLDGETLYFMFRQSGTNTTPVRSGSEFDHVRHLLHQDLQPSHSGSDDQPSIENILMRLSTQYRLGTDITAEVGKIIQDGIDRSDWDNVAMTLCMLANLGEDVFILAHQLTDVAIIHQDASGLKAMSVVVQKSNPALSAQIQERGQAIIDREREEWNALQFRGIDNAISIFASGLLDMPDCVDEQNSVSSKRDERTTRAPLVQAIQLDDLPGLQNELETLTLCSLSFRWRGTKEELSHISALGRRALVLAWESGATESIYRILNALDAVGIGCASTHQPAMTLKQVEEELHSEGAEFASVPPL